MLLIVLLVVFTTHCGQAQLDKYKQTAGYVDVREGAHMFYWLYYTTAPVKNYTERPLIISLVGGPGTSSSGYANFLAVGPLTDDLTERNKTWIKDFNVLFLDSPVGTGFSYVDDPKLLTKTTSEVATDFIVFMQEFYRKNPEFEKVPLYIHGKAYGAKMAVEIAIKLNEAKKKGTVKSDLRGLFMENPWVSPLDHVDAWPRMLDFAALVEKDGYEKVMNAVKKTESLYNQGKFYESRIQRNKTIDVIVEATTAIDYYDIFNGAQTTIPDTTNAGSSVTTNSTSQAQIDDKLRIVMNSIVKKKFNIPESLNWSLNSNSVYEAHTGDFMKPVVGGIEKLLNETKIEVIVFNGNDDLIYSNLGQNAWISKLKWRGAEKFKKLSRQPLWVNNVLEGYYKKLGNFKFYELNGSGFRVTRFDLDAANAILREATTFG